MGTLTLVMTRVYREKSREDSNLIGFWGVGGGFWVGGWVAARFEVEEGDRFAKAGSG